MKKLLTATLMIIDLPKMIHISRKKDEKKGHILLFKWLDFQK